LYRAPNIVREIKSKRLRREGNVACQEEMINAYKILVGKL